MATTVPALAERAIFVLAFANGDGAVVQTQIDDVVNFGRTALQWRGRMGFELHAREFGADYGEPGHVWSGMPFDPADTPSEDHGFVLRLGNDAVAEPLLAEVYSYPMAFSSRQGTIDLTVETEIDALNCGLDVEAQTIEVLGSELRQKDLMLAIPDCDAIGSFLVLNNLVADLTVAEK